MSLLGKIFKAGKKILKVAGVASGGPVAIGATVLSKAAQISAKSSRAALPALTRVAPGVGRTVASAAVGAAAGSIIGDDGHEYTRRARRRRKGITAKDLNSFKRVARLVDKYSKPVHHFRNIKK